MPKGDDKRRRPLVAAVAAAVVGFVLGVVLLWWLGGNPLSDRNEIVYREVAVGSVSPAGDQLCWSEDPDQRDAAQSCAVLAVDPSVELPEAEDVVTIGLVDVHPPDGEARRQIVHLSPAAGPEPQTGDPEG